MNSRSRVLRFPIILVILLMMPPLFANDYEEQMTEYSEKFLTFSQSFVEHASQNVNTEAEYDAALAMSDIAEEFHQHTSYLGDYFLFLKIVSKHKAERELTERLVKLRVESVIKKCSAAVEGINAAAAKVKSESIAAMANDLLTSLEGLQKLLEKINDHHAE